MNKTVKNDIKEDKGHKLNIADGQFKVSSFGYRHQQCLIMLICLTTGYSMRACIGVAIVGMIENHTDPIAVNVTEFNSTNSLNETSLIGSISQNTIDVNGTINDTESNGGFLSALLLAPPYPKFKWSKKIQDVIISSFFWGYMVLQIPVGQLLHKFGPRYLLASALTINCVISFCFPWAAYYGGWIFASACRILQGLSQACIIPGMYGFFGQWAPLEERSRMVGFAQGGQALGTVLGLPITGFIAASPMGWPGIFRFYGILSGLVAFLLFFMVYDTPALHPKISMAERRYIEDGLGLQEGQKQVKRPVPWRHILRCRTLYFIAFSHVSHAWGQIILFAEIPAFMNKVMHVNIKSNGILTALPFLIMWFTNFFFNWFTDWIINKKYLSLTNARKLANTLGCVPPAIGLVVLAYAPKTVAIVEGLLIFICAFKVASNVGSMVTHVDLTPNFAGTTMSVSNFCANLVGSQAPLLVGYLVTDESSEYQWRNVFFVAAGLYFFANLAYCIFGTAEKASWNDPEDEEDLPEMKPMVNKDIENKIRKNSIEIY